MPLLLVFLSHGSTDRCAVFIFIFIFVIYCRLTALREARLFGTGLSGDIRGIGGGLTKLTELRLHDSNVTGHHSSLSFFPMLTVATLPAELCPKQSLPPPNEDGSEISDDDLEAWETVAAEEFKATKKSIPDCNILFL